MKPRLILAIIAAIFFILVLGVEVVLWSVMPKFVQGRVDPHGWAGESAGKSWGSWWMIAIYRVAKTLYETQAVRVQQKRPA